VIKSQSSLLPPPPLKIEAVYFPETLLICITLNTVTPQKKVALKNAQSIKINHSVSLCCRDLRFNKIREIPAHAFKDLKHLNTL
jgi:hypothetical protein